VYSWEGTVELTHSEGEKNLGAADKLCPYDLRGGDRQMAKHLCQREHKFSMVRGFTHRSEGAKEGGQKVSKQLPETRGGAKFKRKNRKKTTSRRFAG